MGPYVGALARSRLIQNHGFWVGRLAFVLCLFMTSAYCLLVYIPFTYRGLVTWNLVPWLTSAVKWHPLLYWLSLALLIWTVKSDLRQGRGKRLAGGLILFLSASGILLLLRPLLTHLAPDALSYIWSIVSLFPLIWVAAIDHTHQGNTVDWTLTNDESHVNLTTAVATAGFLAVLYATISCLRFLLNGKAQMTGAEAAFAMLWSVASHLSIFIVLFAALKLVRRIAGGSTFGGKIEFLLCQLLATVFGALILRNVIFRSVSFTGWKADLYSVTASASLIIYLGGVSVRLRESGERRRGLELFLLPLLAMAPRRRSPLIWRATWLMLLVAGAYGLPVLVAPSDWVFDLQKLITLGVWVASFGFFYSMTARPGQRPLPAIALLLLAIGGIAGYRLCELSRYHFSALPIADNWDAARVLDAYADLDLSFQLSRDTLNTEIKFLTFTRAAALDSGERDADADAFYDFLQQNTNLANPTPAGPVELNLVRSLAPTPGGKPNIFIVVVDSLRQDYLSPYNKAVSFTPNIENFAADSAVFDKAFTRYAGTAYSEPSIWTGSMQIHSEAYLQPFYPLNVLQKLLDVEGYKCLITMDPVLQRIVQSGPNVTELDREIDWTAYDFCQTIAEIKTHLDARTDHQPVFVYTQPQNLHIVMRNHRRRNEPYKEFAGFDGFYATQVDRMDRCFGEFLNFLKQRALYDESIVILTSDHGDDLGEGGRWGHGYYIFPELIRIPLIIHVPPRWQGKLLPGKQEVAFPTDIAPTLYYLLGHRPILHQAICGRPLFVQGTEELAAYQRDTYLIGSSYGAVYGALSNRGDALFISDSINRKDYFFNLASDPNATHNLITPAVQLEQRRLIAEQIDEIKRFFHLSP